MLRQKGEKAINFLTVPRIKFQEHVMYPTVKQLEAFLSTARLGSFSAASESLHTTQSAIC